MRHAIVVGTCLDLELLRGRRYGVTILNSTNELIGEIRRLLSQVRSTPHLNPAERKDEGRFDDGSRNVTSGNVGMDVDLDDDLLFAVMHLAKATGTKNMSMPSGPHQFHSERSKHLFRPPVFLRRLQYLHLWGLSDTPSPSSEASLHLSKLELLVNLKGGLQRVKAPGFAEALHLFDILESARRLEKPRFELPKSSIEFLEEKMPTLREAAALKTQQTRLGVEINRHLPVKSPLCEIFGDIQIFCSWISSLATMGSVGHVQDGNRDSSSSTQMVSAEDVIVLRNLVEYRLLAYCPGVSNSVESVMWTSAMIFVHGVIFPLPHPAAAPLKILIRRLRKALSNHLASRRSELRSFDSLPCGERDSGTRILIWAATMGTMATSDSPDEAHERAFFLDSLRSFVGGSASNISSWTQLKSVLEAYLWADWACDAGGLAVWEMLSVKIAIS
ncbi:uncharacterized protein Z520_00683 [Fonsecaea multimorphosa CBS 102226]|uniref:Uncharacterized protein n=1 Tax=Fonsecaea multimorphosa CBS 102226 TaxID=1442371 RepID=A0A0D2HQ36_9EURO|nr:uncharacterized protein Z520_00683 [Fonsecaea multimorphosa CBS 102226]KIY03991.1 hypothetical protein Z520_00683 [Fonsecaea multimorphosa CBS 102226]OAL31830.1 hypothetical protein AYO22_00700 [Fonsecaea multimorphosa]